MNDVRCESGVACFVILGGSTVSDGCPVTSMKSIHVHVMMVVAVKSNTSFTSLKR